MKLPLEDILYQIALLNLPNVGPRIARKMIHHFGSAEQIFRASKKDLLELGAVGSEILQQGTDASIRFAEGQMNFCEEVGAQVLSFYSNSYPDKLKECFDAPLILYQKGNCSLNRNKMVAIVGTRDCSSYGKSFCKELVVELQKYEISIVSGLAYGIDACAHQSACDNGVLNHAVVAHGLDRVYPASHSGLAKQILKKGSIITEFATGTQPDRENFPKRNRIVAGMVDAVVVIESSIRGGSMITARLGNDYNRDVFAVPGRVSDKRSEGCNYLISNHQAHLLSDPAELVNAMNWQTSSARKEEVSTQPIDLTEAEAKVWQVIGSDLLSIDQIAHESGLSVSEISVQLLMLEMKGCVEQFPGKKYKRV